MDLNQILSWVLGFVGIVGFVLAGQKVWWAWYVNIGNQVLWTAYSVITEQWGFLAAAGFYFVVFCRNAYLWTKEHRSRPDVELKVVTDAAPTQVEGKAYGWHVYFRERYGQWQFGYGRTKKDAVMSYTCGGETEEFMDGKDALAMTKALVQLYIKEPADGRK